MHIYMFPQNVTLRWHIIDVSPIKRSLIIENQLNQQSRVVYLEPSQTSKIAFCKYD